MAKSMEERLEMSFDDLEEDEKEAIMEAKSEDARGETFAHEEIDWDNIESMNLD